MKPAPDQFDDYPVAYVSWNNAVDFCNWLSRREGKTYRLPTEAEWEYCCRAGKAGARYGFGNDDDSLEFHAWFSKNAGDHSHRVARLKANAWGLYDMHGNVWEWCQDSFDPDYYRASPTENPPGGVSGTRVMRGGSWYWAPELCRCAFRHHVAPDLHYSDVGFRVLLVIPPDGQP